MASPLMPMLEVKPSGLPSLKSQINPAIAAQPSEAQITPEKILPEHAHRSDPLGAHLKVQFSDEEIPAANFFVPVVTLSSDELTKRGPILTPSIDYANDACASLGLATDLSIHRKSKFFDHLTASREEYVEKMRTYHVYAELRSSWHHPSSDIRTKVSVHLEQVDKVRVGNRDEFGLITRDPISGMDVLPEWTFDTSQKHILNMIQASTVPKVKKKKKKRKKGKLPSPTLDILTPEEAFLNYQIVVAEEKLRQELVIFHGYEKECLMNEDRFNEIRKHYDQEVQACKTEFIEDETALKVLEDEGSARIRKAEANLLKTEVDITESTALLESKIAEEGHAIALLQKEIGKWANFREGAMIRNQTKIDQLTRAIAAQQQNCADHIRLTEDTVHLAEENAEKEEKQALNDLCQRHIQEVWESLPPEEIQEIENNDILAAELKALNNVSHDLNNDIDNLQKKIVHQAATSQSLLESINLDNAKVVEEKLFRIPLYQTIIPHLQMIKTTGHFGDLDEVMAVTGGLTVIGRTILTKKIIIVNPGRGLSRQILPGQGLMVNESLKPGFLLVPSVNRASVVSQTSSVNQNPEFMDRLNEAIVKSKQKLLFSELDVDFYEDDENNELDNNKSLSVVNDDDANKTIEVYLKEKWLATSVPISFL